MSLQKHQRLAWFAFLIVLPSIALFAPNALVHPDYPDEATIRRLAYDWYQSRNISDLNEYTQLAESFHFENAQERRLFFDSRRTKPSPIELGFFGGPIEPSDIAIAPRPNKLSEFAEAKAFVFVPPYKEHNGRRNLVELEFVHIDGEWKIQFNPLSIYYFKVIDTTVRREIAIKRLESKLDRWKNACADELRMLVSRKRDNALYRLTAYEYGKTKGINDDVHPVPITDSVISQGRQKIGALSRMTPDQIKAKTVHDIRAEITKLREKIEKEQRMSEHRQMMVEWLNAHPEVSKDLGGERANAIEAMREWLKDHDTLEGFEFQPERSRR